MDARLNLGPLGVIWAKNAPPDWEVTTLQRIMSVSSGDFLSPDEFTDEGYPVFGGNGRRGFFRGCNAPAHTMIIGRYGALCGNVHIPDTDFWATEHAFRVKKRAAFNTRFLSYYITALELRFLAARAAQPGLNSRMVREQAIALPDISIQGRIAAFLDRETTRIDELIAKKRAFADLILEREEASFLAAVTGRNTAGPRADSGVEWIGSLPAGWSTPKFTMVARQETGHTPSRKEPTYWVPEECVIPWLSLADVWQLRTGETVYLEDTSEKISEIGMANSAARLLPQGTVVLSRTASVGFVTILARPMATTQDFAGWICGPKIRPKFLYYVLRAMKPEFRRLMMGSTHQTIYMPDIRALRTPLPPLAEQDRIIRELDDSIRCYRQVHSRITASVKKLQELRATLITTAVTGQIDVTTYGKTSTILSELDRMEEEIAE
ncbi:restriction endonuclease subunit S [Rhodobacter sp. NSM]|uniref:restriction endonuclease subunit S n=1 Tax=Rhodobacter sp. NSM TaxID=3457501 RepID=UPI003FD5C22C